MHSATDRTALSASLSSDLVPVFKKPKHRTFRNNRNSNQEQDDCEEVTIVNDIKEVQKLRKRAAGLSSEDGFAAGRDHHRSKEDGSGTSGGNDPFKLKTGGVVDLKTLKRSEWEDVDVEENIKQTFSRESHLRDEDEEMRKYVEEELRRRTGKEDEVSAPCNEKDDANSYGQAEDIFFELPDRLKEIKSSKTEEMLSNQMLCGIPEVDLGIEVKIKNIEETEAAKLRLLRKAADDKRDLAEATTARQNIEKEKAMQFVQHDRYRIDRFTEIGSEVKSNPDRPRTEPVPVIDGDTPKWVLMEKTPGGSHKGPIAVLPGKPRDKQVLGKFKEKERKKKEDEKIQRDKFKKK